MPFKYLRGGDGGIGIQTEALGRAQKQRQRSFPTGMNLVVQFHDHPVQFGDHGVKFHHVGPQVGQLARGGAAIERSGELLQAAHATDRSGATGTTLSAVLKSSLRGAVPQPVKRALRPLARRLGLAAPATWWSGQRPPWSTADRRQSEAGVWCNICGWSGAAFRGIAHTEDATCPQCGAIARDRFLLWCALQRTPVGDLRGARVLETSPRLGLEYRTMMRHWFDYRASDFDNSAHKADVQIDLQDIDLASGTLDLIITPHVLEHVPDTAQALSELHRVLRKGGRMYLQVPMCYGVTAAPTTPEFHADNTPVFWNFGWDLTDRVRQAGFQPTVLVTHAYARMLRSEVAAPAPNGDGFHIDELVRHARPNDVTSFADDATATRLGFLPAYHFATWECVRLD